jgi:hypothetical protein
MMAVADYLYDDEPPPPFLKDARLLRYWGANALDMPAGKPAVYAHVLGVYDAVSGYINAGKRAATAEWSKNNPDLWTIASEVIKKRMDRARNG